MAYYTIYDSNGKITNRVNIPDIDKGLVLKGTLYVNGKAPDDSYVQDKKIVPMPPKPDGNYSFDYQSKKWVIDADKTITDNKILRNTLLQQSDWTQLPDVDLTTAEKTHWKQYRQELRDMTDQDFLDSNFPVY